MVSWQDLTKKLWKAAEKYKYVLIIIAAGIVLWMLPDGNSGPPEEKSVKSSREQTEFSIKEEQQKLAEALCRIEGAERVAVLLMQDTGVETEYAAETRRRVDRTWENGSDTSYSEETDSSPIALSDGSGGQDSVIVREIYPKYRGVFVVCDGGGDPKIQLQIINAVSALLGIGADRITVNKMERGREEKK